MLGGEWLAGSFSDQVTAGLPVRGWGAEWWRRLGHVPLWNPEIFAGMPYVGALGTGDVLYPTAWLRLVLPTVTVINVGFFVHYILAGLFTYLYLRRLGVSWTGSVVGGLAYQLSGLVASYAQPGHDGKLVVTAFLPLVLLGLVIGMRERRLRGFALTALGVGLSILTQHVQMTYYLLIAAGLFALYLAFDLSPATPRDRIQQLALAAAGIALGFGIAGMQLLPAFAHMPLSSRAAGYQGGFAGSTSYGIPWEHVLEFFLKNFVGSGTTYWGSNPIKLHSEYLGLPVVALAVFGAGGRGLADRRLRLWLAGIGALFLLISLGKATPFYRLWWEVMPYVKQMRAPGMAFFVTVFVVACFAALGVERLERRRAEGGAGPVRTWLIAAAVVLILSAVGVFAHMALSLGVGRQVSTAAIRWGGVSSALALAAVAAITWAFLRGRLPAGALATALALIVGADLWLNAKPFWTYSSLHRELFRPDPVTERIKATPPPTPPRVLDLGIVVAPPGARPHAAYPGAVLMGMGIPQLLGEHGIEIRYFDDLMGGRNEWRNIGNLQLWDLFAVRWLIVPAGAGLDSVPGFRRVIPHAVTSAGTAVQLFERAAPAPYARVVPAALSIDSAQIVSTLNDPRMAFDRLVLFDQRDGVPVTGLNELPPPSPSRATLAAWQPGRMSISLAPPPSAPSYLLVAENWYPDWQATVDGAPARVLRGNWSLIAVPLPAGARSVDLAFASRAWGRGKLLTWLSLLVVAGAVAGPALLRLRRRPGA